MNVSVSGMHIHYVHLPSKTKGGGAPPLLFLHGWGGSHASLLPLAQQFASHTRCYLMDLPGFGKSDNPPADWGVFEYAEFVKEFIHAVGIEEPIQLVGHSFGASIGLVVSAEQSEIIEKLVVCAPSWHRSKQFARTSTQQPVQQAVSQGLRHFPFLRRTLYQALFPRSDMLRKPELETNFKKIISQDLTSVVTHISQFTLIVWGGQDTYTPVSDGILLQHLIPHALLSIFPEASHGLPVHHSSLIFPTLHTFLTTKIAR